MVQVRNMKLHWKITDGQRMLPTGAYEITYIERGLKEDGRD